MQLGTQPLDGNYNSLLQGALNWGGVSTLLSLHVVLSPYSLFSLSTVCHSKKLRETQIGESQTDGDE